MMSFPLLAASSGSSKVNRVNGEPVPVRSDEVCSASSSCQRGGQKVSWAAVSLLLIGWTVALVTLVLAATKRITWLDFLYYCSYIKLGVTLTKYVPQVRSHTHTHLTHT